MTFFCIVSGNCNLRFEDLLFTIFDSKDKVSGSGVCFVFSQGNLTPRLTFVDIFLLLLLFLNCIKKKLSLLTLQPLAPLSRYQQHRPHLLSLILPRLKYQEFLKGIENTIA